MHRLIKIILNSYQTDYSVENNLMLKTFGQAMINQFHLFIKTLIKISILLLQVKNISQSYHLSTFSTQNNQPTTVPNGPTKNKTLPFPVIPYPNLPPLHGSLVTLIYPKTSKTSSNSPYCKNVINTTLFQRKSKCCTYRLYGIIRWHSNARKISIQRR